MKVLRELETANMRTTYRDLVEGFASNPSMTAETLRKVAEDGRLVVRKGIAINPSSPADVLMRLVQDEDKNVRFCAAANPRIVD